MRGLRKNSIVSLALEEARSYSLGMIVPPDPLTGTNNGIEMNPKAVEELENAVDALEERIPGIRKILACAEPWRAKTHFYTKVGYHGMVNHASLAVNMATEGISPEFDSIFEDMFAGIFKKRLFKRSDFIKSKEACDAFHEGLKASLAESEESGAMALESMEVSDPNSFVAALWNKSIMVALEDANSKNDFFFSIFAAATAELRAILAKDKAPALLKEGTLREWVKDEVRSVETLSTEGFFDFLKKNKAKQEKPAQQLARLEEEVKTLKNPAAVALLEGKAPLDEEFARRLLAIANDNPAPSQFHHKNGPILSAIAQLVKLPILDPGQIAEEINEASSVDELKQTLDKFCKVMSPHLAIIAKVTKPVMVDQANAKALYADITTRYGTNRANVAKLQYEKTGWPYEAAQFAQYFGYPYGALGNRDGVSEDLYNEDPNTYKAYLAKLEKIDLETARLEELCLRACPGDDDFQFLLYARIALLSAVLTIERGKKQLSKESIATTPLPSKETKMKFDPTKLSFEELYAHRAEEVREHKERLQSELADLSARLIDIDPLYTRLLDFCADGILKNEGGINEVLGQLGCGECYDATRYAERFTSDKFPPRIEALRRNDEQLIQLLQKASLFVDSVKRSGLFDELRTGNVDAINDVINDIEKTMFDAASQALPTAMEYSCDAVDAFLDTFAEKSSLSPVQWEIAFTANRGGFYAVRDIDKYGSLSLDDFSPQIIFQCLNKLDPNTRERAERVGMLCLKAWQLLDRGVAVPLDLIESFQRANIEETLTILRAAQRATPSPLEGKEVMATEAFDYHNGLVVTKQHNPESAEALKSQFFGFGKKKEQPTRVRESRKPVDQQTVSGLTSERQTQLGKAIAAFSDCAELKELHYHNIADESSFYAKIAEQCGAKDFDYTRFFANYLKAQGFYTEFHLDYALQVTTKGSRLQKLVLKLVDFISAYVNEENMRTVVDAVNGQTSTTDPYTRVALRVVERFDRYDIVEELRKGNIDSAKDMIKPTNRYNVAKLESEAVLSDDFDARLGGSSIPKVYDAYQLVCHQLGCANALADYLGRSDRGLATSFMKSRDTLWAMADVLAYVLYSYNALRGALTNIYLGQIRFLDVLLKE